jgi:N-acetylglutamate synthase
MNNVSIRTLSFGDYNAVIDLWKNTESMSQTSADEPEPFSRFLENNSAYCFVAESNGNIIGTVLCGTDERRGYLYHLAVLPEYRRQGLGSLLVNKSLAALQSRGIEKCHLFVYENNKSACLFYDAQGWTRRNDIFVYSKNIDSKDLK